MDGLLKLSCKAFPKAIQTKPLPQHCKTNNSSSVSTSILPKVPLSASIETFKKPSGDMNFKTIFFPRTGIVDTPHKISNGYNTGFINVFCNLSSRHIKLFCYDHGQYPWGRHKVKGLLAFICRSLSIGANARNTCLPLHVLIGLLHFNLTSLDDLLTVHKKFIKHLLSSSYMRTDVPTINAILNRFKLKDSVCFRRIIHLQHGSSKNFILLNEHCGNIKKQQIFLIHSQNHFFLGLKSYPF